MNVGRSQETITQWLSEHVKRHPTPKTITLSKFEVNTGRYSGQFAVAFDDREFIEGFRFSLGANGKPEVYLPIYHSPLGVPASYAAIEITEETKSAIARLLSSVLPEMKPLGLDKDTGVMVLHTTHSDADRIIDAKRYRQLMDEIVQPGFRTVMSVDQLS